MMCTGEVYAEFTSLVEGVRCTWQRRSPGGAETLIVPDGCVDLVWFSDGRLEIAGPDTAARWFRTASAVDVVGVRLSPGTARRVVGMAIGDLRDQQASLDSLDSWDRSWRTGVGRLQQLSTACLTMRRRALGTLVSAHTTAGTGDALVEVAVERLRRSPETRVSALADDLGISSRQLQRRFVDAVGYAPKTFARITRLDQLLLRATTAPDLPSAALQAGYASQSHMGDEVRALTSLTPVRFLEDRAVRPSYPRRHDL